MAEIQTKEPEAAEPQAPPTPRRASRRRKPETPAPETPAPETSPAEAPTGEALETSTGETPAEALTGEAPKTPDAAADPQPKAERDEARPRTTEPPNEAESPAEELFGEVMADGEDSPNSLLLDLEDGEDARPATSGALIILDLGPDVDVVSAPAAARTGVDLTGRPASDEIEKPFFDGADDETATIMDTINPDGGGADSEALDLGGPKPEAPAKARGRRRQEAAPAAAPAAAAPMTPTKAGRIMRAAQTRLSRSGRPKGGNPIPRPRPVTPGSGPDQPARKRPFWFKPPSLPK